MLPEYYDSIKKEYCEKLDFLKSELDKLSGSTGGPEAIAAYQQTIIDTCTAMEDDWLVDADMIVGAFEEICELLFQAAGSQTDVTENIRNKLDSMTGMFDEVFVREERKLSIALIERNEERYLKEWLEYHLMMGVDHFYVYDHGSTDGSMEVLRPYIDKGIVELTQVEGDYLPTQISVYNDALKRSRYNTRYLALIDTDEFLTPMKHDSAIEAIEYIFRSYEETPFKAVGSCAAGGIGVNWRVFGTSGHAKPVDGPVIEEYVKRGPDDLMVNNHIKTICKPLAVKQIVNPHFAIYESGFWCISEHGSLIPGPFFYDSKGDILRLNHYYVKSEEEYKSRRLNFKRSEAGRQRLATEEEITHTNEVTDDTMKRFVDRLKDRL